MTIERGP